MTSPSVLDALVRRAGAVFAERNGSKVPAHYGSPAGELAVCVRAVGFGDRSDLGKLMVSGAAVTVEALSRRLTGVALAAQGACFSEGAWWCSVPGGLVVVCEAPARVALLAALRVRARTIPGVEVADCSDAWAALAVVGPRTVPLLAAVGALGSDANPLAGAHFACSHIAGVQVYVLLESDRRALVLVKADAAEGIWRTVSDEGRAFGLSLVGIEALQRFAMLERMAPRPCTAVPPI
jgi:glycine cleavage system aminomethyltransferase T